MATSLLLDSLDGDIQFKDGALVWGNTNNQNQHDILISYQGEWKQFPYVGVGLESYEGASFNITALKNSINTQLRSDGFMIRIPTINFNPNGTLNVTTNATKP